MGDVSEVFWADSRFFQGMAGRLENDNVMIYNKVKRVHPVSFANSRQSGGAREL